MPTKNIKKGLSGCVHQSDLNGALKLIRNGADINAKQDFGVRPIIAAINSGNPKTLTFVIEHRADVNIDKGHPMRAMIDYVIDCMIQEERDEPFPESLEMLEILLENGADLELKDENDERPVDLISAYAGSEKNLKKLKAIFRPLIPNIDNLL